MSSPLYVHDFVREFKNTEAAATWALSRNPYGSGYRLFSSFIATSSAIDYYWVHTGGSVASYTICMHGFYAYRISRDYSLNFTRGFDMEGT